MILNWQSNWLWNWEEVPHGHLRSSRIQSSLRQWSCESVEVLRLLSGDNGEETSGFLGCWVCWENGLGSGQLNPIPEIQHDIIDRNLDLGIITETWIKEGDKAVLHTLLPKDCLMKSTPKMWPNWRRSCHGLHIRFGFRWGWKILL